MDFFERFIDNNYNIKQNLSSKNSVSEAIAMVYFELEKFPIIQTRIVDNFINICKKNNVFSFYIYNTETSEINKDTSNAQHYIWIIKMLLDMYKKSSNILYKEYFNQIILFLKNNHIKDNYLINWIDTNNIEDSNLSSIKYYTAIDSIYEIDNTFFKFIFSSIDYHKNINILYSIYNINTKKMYNTDNKIDSHQLMEFIEGLFNIYELTKDKYYYDYCINIINNNIDEIILDNSVFSKLQVYYFIIKYNISITKEKLSILKNYIQYVINHQIITNNSLVYFNKPMQDNIFTQIYLYRLIKNNYFKYDLIGNIIVQEILNNMSQDITAFDFLKEDNIDNNIFFNNKIQNGNLYFDILLPLNNINYKATNRFIFIGNIVNFNLELNKIGIFIRNKLLNIKNIVIQGSGVNGYNIYKNLKNNNKHEYNKIKINGNSNLKLLESDNYIPTKNDLIIWTNEEFKYKINELNFLPHHIIFPIDDKYEFSKYIITYDEIPIPFYINLKNLSDNKNYVLKTKSSVCDNRLRGKKLTKKELCYMEINFNEYFIQDFIDNGVLNTSICGFFNYIDNNLNILLTVKKIVGYGTDLNFPCGAVVKTCDDNNILFNRTIKLLNNLQYNGPFELEFIFDKIKNVYYICELNPRFWMQNSIFNFNNENMIVQRYIGDKQLYDLSILKKRLWIYNIQHSNKEIIKKINESISKYKDYEIIFSHNSSNPLYPQKI